VDGEGGLLIKAPRGFQSVARAQDTKAQHAGPSMGSADLQLGPISVLGAGGVA
jgi:hypothetical protein